MNEKSIATLFEISQWNHNHEVKLPSVQRGFVWKPFQMENLWDSLLRGYPVGSFIFAPADDEKKADSLLDGQQRATSIGLAFADPSIHKDVFNAKDILFFLDLKIPEEKDTRAYVFRVITKSHPWGYNRESNRDPLTRPNIEDAKEKYELLEGQNYYEMDIERFWPYDSGIPVPAHLFLEAARDKEKGLKWLEEQVFAWVGKVKGTKGFTSHQLLLDQLKLSFSSNTKYAGKDYYGIQFLLKKFERMLDLTTIPMKFLLEFEEVNRIQENKDPAEEDTEINDLNDQQEMKEHHDLDDVENLFVRLNSAGTPLRGEDLNYSILKTALNNTDTVRIIENACKGIMSAASFIAVSYRLFQHKKNINVAVNLRIKTKDFQRAIRDKDEVKDYEETLVNELIPVLIRARNILSDDDPESFKLSTFSLSNLCHRSPHMMMVLMYRLWKMEDKLEEDKEIQKKVIGLLTLLCWFVKGTRSSNKYDPLMRTIWPLVKNLPAAEFWSNIPVAAATESSLLLPLFNKRKMNTTRDEIKEVHRSRKDKGTFDSLDDNESLLLRKIFSEKSFILYAQRKYFKSSFKDIEFHLDDTDVPFDWDHISPQLLIKNKKGITKPLADWYQSIGNLRALSYSKNRARGAKPPSIDMDRKSAEESFCNFNHWSKHSFTKDDLDDKNQKVIFNLIVDRCFGLFSKWHDDLDVGKLLPTKTTLLKNFKQCLGPQWVEEDNEFRISGQKGGVGIYVYFSGAEDNLYEDNKTEIGIWTPKENELKKALVRSDHNPSLSDDEDTYIVYKNTTLVFDSHEMSLLLLQQMIDYLDCLRPEIRQATIDTFKKCINKEVIKELKWNELGVYSTRG